jgi:hypothetical protein
MLPHHIELMRQQSKSQVKKLKGMDGQILVEASTPYQRNF